MELAIFHKKNEDFTLTETLILRNIFIRYYWCPVKNYEL